QDAALALHYRTMIDRIRAAEHRVAPHSEELTEAAARSLAKLMSYKDEYEVARLYSDGGFLASLKEQFEDWDRLEIHLAPPALGQAKRRYGPWMLKLMPLLARLKVLRRTVFDPFGRTKERKRERALIREFEHVLEQVIDHLTPANHSIAVEIATLPRQIRGFGPVKEKAIGEYHQRLTELGQRFALD
ncbi:MAG: indolepyruvate ferredoxin oxidoreductase family protein, partial [Rhodospirillaceae bacterium]|nr:indolepyruvate ferredoxin oxidoreductase family protein [Rhodospirillaceae bacterium]